MYMYWLSSDGNGFIESEKYVHIAGFYTMTIQVVFKGYNI